MQIRDAAEALGVHYQTAYGWVRQGVLPARKNGRGYQVLEADVCAFAARRAAGTPPQSQIQVRDWAPQADRLHAALVAGDEILARKRLDRLAAGVPLVDLCERVVGPALREDRWIVHHLAHDLPVAEVVRMAAETGASLVVLSSATAKAASAAATAADQIISASPSRHVLAGRPGDSLRQLLQQARACTQ